MQLTGVSYIRNGVRHSLLGEEILASLALSRGCRKRFVNSFQFRALSCLFTLNGLSPESGTLSLCNPAYA